MACVSKSTSRFGFSALFFVSLVVIVNSSRLAFTYLNRDAVGTFRYSIRNVLRPLNDNEIGLIGNEIIPSECIEFHRALKTIGVDVNQALPSASRRTVLKSARPVATRLYVA